MLEQDARGVVDDFGVQLQGVERDQGFGPFHTFCNARAALKRAGKRLATQASHKGGNLVGQCFTRFGHLGAHDREFPLAFGVIHPVEKATAFHRVVQVTRAVAGQNGDGHGRGALGTEFGDGDLVLA